MDEKHQRPSRRTVIQGLAGLASVSATVVVSGCASAPRPGPAATQTPGAATVPAGRTDPSRPSTRTATSPTTPTVTPAILTQPGPDIATGPTNRPAVALTFHGAGDAALTAQALTIAATAKARLTVFAVGQWLSANPHLGRDIVAAGHDLGNHTWSHQTMTRLTAAQAVQEVRDGAHAVTVSVGSPGLLFRPSGTPTSTATIRSAAAASGYQRCISYDVDPEDYLDPGPTAVVSRTLAGVRAGSIVSLHLGHPGTIEALPAILRGLAARGLTAVSLTDLLGPA